jgi:hypothetical protein
MPERYGSLLKNGASNLPNGSENLTARKIPINIPASPISFRIIPSLKPSINPTTKKTIMI